MVEPEVAAAASLVQHDVDAWRGGRTRYAERRVAVERLLQRARSEGAARLHRERPQDDDERGVTTGL